jgi:hypothetical protein
VAAKEEIATSPAVRVVVVVLVIAAVAVGALVLLSASDLHLLRHTLPGHIFHYIRRLF